MTVPPTKADGPGIFPLPRYVEVGPLRVGIGSVRLKGGHAVIRDPEAAWTLEVAGADVTARPAAGDLDVSGRLDTLRVEALGRREQIERVAVDGRLAADLLRIRQIDWHWRGGRDAARRRDAPSVAREPRGVPAPRRATSASRRSRRRPVSISGSTARRRSAPTSPVPPQRRGSRPGPDPRARLAAVTAQDVTIEGEWGDDKLRLDDIQARLGTGRLRGRLEAVPISDRRREPSRSMCARVVLPGSLAGLGAGTAVAEGRVRDRRHRPGPGSRPPGAASPPRSTAASRRAARSPCAGSSTSISRRSAEPWASAR